MQILKDGMLIEEFLNRGVKAVYPSKEALRKKLMSGERLRVYQGFDPSGPYLHVGHAMGIRALRILQQLGHEVIFLVGDFTAKIGDPDKGKTRGILSEEKIEENMSGWKEQANQLIDFEGENPVRFERNHKWLSKLTLEETIKLMSNVTVQQLLERDLFAERINTNTPLGLHEFLYPLMQGYDGVAMEVDMEIGGADQTFNMLVGRQLSKIYLNKEKFVRTNKMMEAPEGKTMNKTKGNGINLSDSPEDMYGKSMSYPDNLIVNGLELLTDVPTKQIERIKLAIESGDNPLEFKKLMAFEIVKVIKGEKVAVTAQQYFEKTVQNQELPKEIPEVSFDKKGPLYKILSAMAPEMSRTQIRKVVEQGGLMINNEKHTNPMEETKLKSGDIVKLGKRRYAKAK